MTNCENSDIAWLQLKAWIASIEEVARDFHGSYPREFLERVYALALDNWLYALSLQTGITLPLSNNIEGGLENFLNICASTGLLKDLAHCEIKKLDMDAVELSIYRCPFKEACLHLTSKGLKSHLLTCPFIGMARVATSRSTGIECGGENTGLDPLHSQCSGIIERVSAS